ncbi:MAG: signal peptidase I [Fimbriimonadaceae bacterium]|nr:signal peptidase I [Fimbriimonadaceae bacterium]
MKRKTFTGFTLVLVLMLGVAVFFQSKFRQVIVSGSSMEPTFHSGQKVWISNAYGLFGGIKRKDVVVLAGERAGEFLIKRVYWTEGEVVEPDARSRDIGFLSEYRVPPGKVWVMGDNRSVSEDSRAFGPVDVDKVLGKVIKY